MESNDKLRLKANRKFLVENLQAEEVLDKLVEEMVLNDDDVEEIGTLPTNKKKVTKILDILPKRGPNAYPSLKEAVQENQSFIAEKLDQTDLEEVRQKIAASHQGHSKQKAREENCKPSTPVQVESAEVYEVGPSLFMVLADNASVMNNWRSVARYLDLPESDINDIKHRERDNLKEQTYECFRMWHERKGSAATIKVLVKALRKCHMNSVADAISGSLSDSVSGKTKK